MIGEGFNPKHIDSSGRIIITNRNELGHIVLRQTPLQATRNLSFELISTLDHNENGSIEHYWLANMDTTGVPDLSIDYGERVNISVKAIHFRKSGNLKNQYHTNDGQWETPVKTSSFTIKNLAPGFNTIYFRALINEELVSTEIKLNVTVSTPFYLTFWFYLLLFISLIAIVILVVRARTHKLKRRQRELETQISEATSEIRVQKESIEEAHNEIKDSISYAKRIQTATLPPKKLVKSYMPNSFILYKPKDIVAGDFYWMEPIEKEGITLFAAADCTGHGVPGAMVSVICNNGLNRSVREKGNRDPGLILDETIRIVEEEFDKSEEDVKDGMDIALFSLKGKTLKFAGANNPLWVIRKGTKEIEVYKGNKQLIGKFDKPTPFETTTVELNEGDTFYVFSDGYAEQFGGEQNKKFKSVNFKMLLLSIQDQSMSDQRDALERAFSAWQGDMDQVDDVCVIGVRI